MDVETTLAEARELTARLLALSGDPDSYPVTKIATLGAELAQKFEALDGWLSRGGFAPAAWRGAETEDHR